MADAPAPLRERAGEPEPSAESVRGILKGYELATEWAELERVSELLTTHFGETTRSSVSEHLADVIARLSGARAATSAEPVAWLALYADDAHGSVYGFYRDKEEADRQVAVNQKRGEKLLRLSALYSHPAPQVAALREERDEALNRAEGQAREIQRQSQRIADLDGVWHEAERQVASLSAALEAAKPDAEITAEEIRLVREQGEVLVRSYEQPGARRQPYEWHDGKTLIALADKLAALPSGDATR